MGTASPFSASPRRGSPGFTLMEVVLALALMALLLSLVQGAYSGAVRSRDAARRDTEQVHAASVLLDRLAVEVAAAYAGPPPADPREAASWFIVDNELEALATLQFTTRLDPVEGGFSGEEAEVEYFVEEDEEGYLRIYRREAREVDRDPEEGGIPYDVFRNLDRFEILCWDGEEWVDGWDSRDRPDPPHLPVMIRVDLAWGADEDGEGGELVQTWLPLYGSGEIL